MIGAREHLTPTSPSVVSLRIILLYSYEQGMVRIIAK